MSSICSPPIQSISLHHRIGRGQSNIICSSSKPRTPCSKSPSLSVSTGRRQWLFFLSAASFTAGEQLKAGAQDIGLFGIRKRLRDAEKEAEEIVKEGFETAERGLESAEKGLESAEQGLQNAEKGIEKVEEEIETAVSFGGLAQAGAVAGAEFVGVLVATSVVNSILSPEGQNS